MEAVNITAYNIDVSQIETLKAFLKALKIKFDMSISKEKDPFNPEFVAKILKGDNDFAAGKGIKMSVSEFKSLCK